MDRRQKFIEDLDDMTNRVADLHLPPNIADDITERLEAIMEDVLEQVELRSTDWEA